MSNRDVEFCVGFDVSGMNQRDEFDEMKSLHNVLCEVYGE